MLWLKSSTAFPNHIRMIKNEEIPAGVFFSLGLSRWVFQWRTDHETENADPSTYPLDHGLIECGS
jgi:hypothetical protein